MSSASVSTPEGFDLRAAKYAFNWICESFITGVSWQTKVRTDLEIRIENYGLIVGYSNLFRRREICWVNDCSTQTTEGIECRLEYDVYERIVSGDTVVQEHLPRHSDALPSESVLIERFGVVWNWCGLRQSEVIIRVLAGYD